MDVEVRLDYRPEYTIKEYNEIPETKTKVELIDGAIIVYPCEHGRHQAVASDLTDKFMSAMPDNLTMLTRIGLYISKDTSFIPDMVIGYKDKFKERMDKDYFIPESILLVVEIESKSSKLIDRITKHSKYARAGIQCYVRVVMNDADNPEVYVYELNNKNRYKKEMSYAKSGEIVNISNPIKLSFDPKELVS